MQIRRYGIDGRAGLVSRYPEVADEDWMRGIAEIVDFRHPLRAPCGIAADEIGNAGIAFPPALMRIPQSGDDRGQLRWLGRIGDVPDLVRLGSECAKQVDLALVGLRQLRACAGAYHLRPAGFTLSGITGNVGEIFRLAWIGDVDDRCAVRL